MINDKDLLNTKYQNILNWSPVGIYHSSPEGNIIAANISLARMLGYSEENELLGKIRMHDLYFNPEDRDDLFRTYNNIINEPLRNKELLWKRKDGSPIWILLTAHIVLDADNSFQYCEGFVLDIESQKETIRDLEQSVSGFKATLESINEGILVVNQQGIVTNYNTKFLEFLKNPPLLNGLIKDEDLIAYVIDNFEDKDAFLEGVKSIYSSPFSDSFDVLKLKDGRVIERFSHPQIIDNKPVGRVWSFRDMTGKIKASELLKKSENQYRVLFEGANDSIFIMSQDEFIACNEMTLTIFECEAKENIIGKHPWEYSPEYQPDGCYSKEKARIYIEAALNGDPQRFYWSHKTFTGRLIDCEVSLNRITFDDSVFLQAIVRDISERMKSESIIRENEERFRRVFESSPLGIVMVSSNATFIDVNPVFSDMLGYTREELKSLSLRTITHPDHITSDLENLRKLIKGEIQFYHTDKRYFKKNGEIIWGSVTVTSVLNVKSQFLYFLGMIEDLTERKKAEDEIHDREFWLSQSQRFARIGTYYLDVKTGIWKCTEVLDEIFGIPADYPKTIESWASIISEDDRQMMVDYFAKNVIEQNNAFNKQYRIRRMCDNQIRWVHGRGDLTYDEQGNTLAMLGSISDITEQKILEEELRIAKEKAEESSRLKSSLLLNISHEFRTPMNGILGFAELLSETIKEPGQKRMAENIMLSGNRLKVTLDSLVDLSQIQADSKMLKLERTDINGIIQYVINNFGDIATVKNLALETDCEPGLCVLADSKLISNVIHHLVDNAFKFTNSGFVRIISRTDSLQNRAVISVMDSGIGIASEHLEMVFDEFRQVSEGMGRYYEGTGLGLTLCKKFVGMMKGEIRVNSEPGIGSEFTVFLPLAGNSDTGEQENVISVPVPAARITTGKKKPLVLVVEDQEYNLELIEIYLENICFTERALDGPSAVEMASKKKYDAILIDVNLGPGMDGLEATRIIKTFPGYEDIPVIAVTGYTTMEEKENILANGCTHYLSKPYNRQGLVTVFRDALG
ncbi:MAG: PAS domain S-box protein [Bacteroidales bacterium]